MKAKKRRKAGFLGIVILLGIVCFQSPAQGALSVRKRHAKAIKQLKKEGFQGIDKALKTFNQLIKEAPDFLAAYISAADAYLLKYEFSKRKDRKWLKKALKYLNTCIRKGKNLDVAYFKRAIIYFNLNRPGDAEDSIKRPWRLIPKTLTRVFFIYRVFFPLKRLRRHVNLQPLPLKISPAIRPP